MRNTNSGIKVFATPGADGALVIKIIPNENNFLIGGYSDGNGGDRTELSKGSNDIWLIKINSDGIKIWDKSLGGSGLDYVHGLDFDNDSKIILGGFSSSPASGDKTINGPGAWFIKLASNCPPQTSAFITLGDSLTLKANPCTGTVNWSNGMTGNSIVIKPTINTVYTATCSTTCTSPASTPFSVTVSTGICETIKSGSWTDPTIWSSNRVPTATDDVIINIGHTVTDTGNTIRAKSLNYRGGILKLSSITNLILGN
jgi:hypothetical protein